MYIIVYFVYLVCFVYFVGRERVCFRLFVCSVEERVYLVYFGLFRRRIRRYLIKFDIIAPVFICLVVKLVKMFLADISLVEGDIQMTSAPPLRRTSRYRETG